MNDKLMKSILAMDSYNRGYDAKIHFGNDENNSEAINGVTKIGQATVYDSDNGNEAQAADFYAIAYEYNNETVISYRGTDNIWADMQEGWPIDAFGNGQANQAELAYAFYQEVAGEDQDPFSANISLTGHSLGGGLAGLVGGVYGRETTGFDAMEYNDAVQEIYDISTHYDITYFTTVYPSIQHEEENQSWDRIEELQNNADVFGISYDFVNPEVHAAVYNDFTPKFPDFGDVSNYHIDGEILHNMTYIGDESPSAPYDIGGDPDGIWGRRPLCQRRGSMRKLVLWFFMFFLISPAFAGDEKGNIETPYNESLQMDYTKNLSLCQEFMDILQLPENQNYLMGYEAIQQYRKRFSQSQFLQFMLRLRRSRQLIFFSENKNFKNPSWRNLTDKEAYKEWEGYIQRQKSLRGEAASVYKKDYILQKTEMDIDRDGYADTLYRQKGDDYEMMVKDDGSQFAKRFNGPFPHLYWQVFYYKGKPYFISSSLASLNISEPKSRAVSDNDQIQREFYWDGVCYYRFENKN